MPVSHADQQRHQLLPLVAASSFIRTSTSGDNLRQQIVSLSVPVQDYRMSSISGSDVTHAVVTNPRRASKL